MVLLIIGMENDKNKINIMIKKTIILIDPVFGKIVLKKLFKIFFSESILNTKNGKEKLQIKTNELDL